jgi:hypothetical protein
VKVGEVTRLLEGIARGLGDLSKTTSAGLIGFQVAMQPFAEQTVDQFVTFLGQCEEYKRTGQAVAPKGMLKTQAKPKGGALTVAEASERVRGLLGEINQGTVTNSRIDSLLSDIQKGFTKPKWLELLATLEIAGKSKTIGEAVAKVRQVLNSQLEMHVKGQAHDFVG